MLPLPQWQVCSKQGSVLFDNEDKNMRTEDWIRVTDRLPELIDHCVCSVFVLTAYEVQYEYLGRVRYTQVACYDYKEKGWFTNEDRQIEGEVTHWMPIVLPRED